MPEVKKVSQDNLRPIHIFYKFFLKPIAKIYLLIFVNEALFYTMPRHLGLRVTQLHNFNNITCNLKTLGGKEFSAIWPYLDKVISDFLKE